MTVTRSSAAERGTSRGRGVPSGRLDEAAWLLAAAVVTAFGLLLVYQAKARSVEEAAQALAAGRAANLNAMPSRESLVPFLTAFPDGPERHFAARRIYNQLGAAPNVGALLRIRVTAAEVKRTRGLATLTARFEDAGWPASLTLLSREQFRRLKPVFVVRRPEQFRAQFFLWTAVFFTVFFAAHIWWRLRSFTGDRAILPALLLLCGAGLILMVSLRDPLRDAMIFAEFAQGAAAGCVILAFASSVDYRRALGGLSFVPLLASFLLSIALIIWGYGPGTSDAKVNLLGFQPVEVIRILLVFFLAGYFAQRWEILRDLEEKRPSVAALSRWVKLPPLEYALPVFASVLLSLLFFFFQKDLGPALVFACLFLALYGIARNAAVLVTAGLLLMLSGFSAGYLLNVPRTVGDRVSMWLSPWNNVARGGDQLAHSLWALSTGGVFGTGPGLGDPQVVPAAHTDLVLSALGEEWGFAGLAAILAIYVALIVKAFRIALRTRTDYDFFLAAGLTLATALQLLLIAGGALGVLPLSGVVTPFMSYGRTALAANFFVFAILLSISRQRGDGSHTEPFRAPLLRTGAVLAGLGAVIVLKAAYIQVVRSDPTVGAGALVVQADGVRRYQYNPRFLEIMRELPKGTIFDRNGLPLATSNCEELAGHRAAFQRMGIGVERACPPGEARHYPLGGAAFHVLGDLRTRARWAASNTSFIERDSAIRLRGYDDRARIEEVRDPRTGKMDRVLRFDYRELVPLLRHRHEPEHPSVRRILDRKRDVKISIDARLQLKTAEILRGALRAAGKEKGAAVVLDAESGDLLASVSFPQPPARPEEAGEETGALLDRARYGLYPPGSTFKIVTAIAALRHDPPLVQETFSCVRLPDGRVGNYIKGSSRPIRDDIQDQNPHGTVNLEKGLVVSCNAFFAQLGTYRVGAAGLHGAASLAGIATAQPDTPAQLRRALPQASYGQGQVVASPFQMARVAAAVANGGMMPAGRWVIDESNERSEAPRQLLPRAQAELLARYMREVVTQGTGRRAAQGEVAIGGKTGTAEVAGAPSHAWFVGFAPHGGARRIAFAVVIENGRYGGTAAAPAAGEIAAAARALGVIR